jgi:hypothetical protein
VKIVAVVETGGGEVPAVPPPLAALVESPDP